jgi:transcription elongation GreA/GreB family factor
MSTQFSKPGLLAELIGRTQADLDALTFAQRETQAGATHAEAKSEGDKDTRAIEQEYLARGQAKRVEELRASLAALSLVDPRPLKPADAVASGALVTVEENGEQRRFFMAPEGGGTRLAGGRVQVVTPKSPLGEALLGARAGDDCQVLVAGKLLELEVVGVE